LRGISVMVLSTISLVMRRTDPVWRFSMINSRKELNGLRTPF